LHVIPHRRTIAAAMTLVWPTIERFAIPHGTAVPVTLAFAAAPYPEYAAVVPSGTSHG
jgi:hypothetical protein